jgi:hypothetical protein
VTGAGTVKTGGGWVGADSVCGVGISGSCPDGLAGDRPPPPRIPPDEAAVWISDGGDCLFGAWIEGGVVAGAELGCWGSIRCSATTGGGGAGATETGGRVSMARAAVGASAGSAELAGSVAPAWLRGIVAVDEATGREGRQSQIEKPPATRRTTAAAQSPYRRPIVRTGICTVDKVGTRERERSRSAFFNASRMNDMLYSAPRYGARRDSDGVPGSCAAKVSWASVSSPTSPSASKDRLP